MMSWFDALATTAVAALTASVLPAVILLVIGVLVIRIVVKVVASALEKTKLEKAAHSLILSVVRVVLYILLGLMVATKLGIDIERWHCNNYAIATFKPCTHQFRHADEHNHD